MMKWMKKKKESSAPVKNAIRKSEEQEEKKTKEAKKKPTQRKKMKPSSKPRLERNRKGLNLVSLINGAILIDPRLRKQTPFILVIVVIVFLYIGVDYVATKRIREIESLKIELEDLHNEQILIKSALDNYSRQSSMVKKLNDSLQIKPSRKPPVKLIVKEVK